MTKKFIALSAKELRRAAAEAFASKNTYKTLYQTADGQCFENEGDAVGHSKTLGLTRKEDVPELLRGDYAEEAAEVIDESNTNTKAVMEEIKADAIAAEAAKQALLEVTKPKKK